jgi:hypothetical protein
MSKKTIYAKYFAFRRKTRKKNISRNSITKKKPHEEKIRLLRD